MAVGMMEAMLLSGSLRVGKKEGNRRTAEKPSCKFSFEGFSSAAASDAEMAGVGQAELSQVGMERCVSRFLQLAARTFP